MNIPTNNNRKTKYISRAMRFKDSNGKKVLYCQYYYHTPKKKKTAEEIKISKKLYQAKYLQQVVKPKRAKLAKEKNAKVMFDKKNS